MTNSKIRINEIDIIYNSIKEENFGSFGGDETDREDLVLIAHDIFTSVKPLFDFSITIKTVQYCGNLYAVKLENGSIVEIHSIKIISAIKTVNLIK